MNIQGIIPALVTPFNEDHSVNYSALRALVNRLIDNGVGGFYVCGSTAECFLLSDAERMKVMEVVTEETNGRVPVIAHVGNISTATAVEYAKHAASCGVSAVSSVPPFYYKFGLEEIGDYYASISDAVDLPLIVYSIPAFSGVAVTADNLDKITGRCNAAGLKYTSYDLFELEKIHRKYPDLKLYNGHDEVFVNALPIGLTGAIGSTFNIMPHRYMSIKKAFEAGDMEKASALQAETNEFIQTLISTGVNQGVKYLLTKSGIPCGDCRPPFGTLDDSKKALLDSFYERVLEPTL